MSDKNMHKLGIGYRSEIDGLRCIAVLAVVFFHFSVSGFSGGFVGVDIFFVISGFLIGGILWQELVTNGRISFSRFYLRRFKRLAPAFIFMAVVTSITAYFILLPFEFREFGKALISSTIYLSNVLFFRQSGYFDNSAEDKVLLHTWSLSVEEQFYIFLPLLIFIFATRHRLLWLVLISIFSLSLFACVWFTNVSHNATFFLFPFRAWELLAGVLLAIYGQKTQEDWQHGSLPSWVGLSMLAGAIGFTHSGENFPGIQVLVPVVGTVLIIWNGRANNLVNRALSSPIPVFIGLLSYSLYIWHWPVLTLSKYYQNGYSGIPEAALWLGLVFVLAVASWWFVERPVRRAKSLTAPALVGFVTVSSLCLLTLGSVVYLKNGLPNRFNENTRMHIDATADFLQDWSRCYVPEDGLLRSIEVCPIGPEGAVPKVLVWGDSHLRAFKEGIAQAALDHAQAGLLIWRGGCPPLFAGVSKKESASTHQEDTQCLKTTQQIEKAIPLLSEIDTVLLVGRWSYYASGQGIGNDKQNRIELSAPTQSDIRIDTQHALFADAMVQTIRIISNSVQDIYVLRQIPEIPDYSSRKVARMMAHGRIAAGKELDALMFVSTKDLGVRTAPSEKPFRELEASGDITYLDSWPSVCTAKGCSAQVDGTVLYFDNNHITNSAARRMRNLFAPVFNAPARVVIQ